MTHNYMMSQASEFDLQLMAEAGRTIGLRTRIENFRELRVVAFSAALLGDFDHPCVRIRHRYNPLDDDKQASTLAAVACINVYHMPDADACLAETYARSSEPNGPPRLIRESVDYMSRSARDKTAAMRRAVVTVAAALYRAALEAEGGNRV
ncbi:hypothetical protein PPN31114_03537 [Pandoraea pneumonica]|uniref:Uncharacterized protein n=1 Tax=Pandoraea pneumonica TaxID=2508299 RepID=A0A5E4WY89_9BURK|nr:hypothetical protein [Pandoraea pneumonica]VVE28694.1 hypothetical protein PPN31114_03537 [Pandoraea pneumonica]